MKVVMCNKLNWLNVKPLRKLFSCKIFPPSHQIQRILFFFYFHQTHTHLHTVVSFCTVIPVLYTALLLIMVPLAACNRVALNLIVPNSQPGPLTDKLHSQSVGARQLSSTHSCIYRLKQSLFCLFFWFFFFFSMSPFSTWFTVDWSS